VTTTRYRIVFMLLGLALIGVVVFAVVFAPSGRDPGLPDAVESYSPVDGANVARQVQIVVDLEAGYVLELTVDGVPVPAVEIVGDDISGRYTWEPGPGKAFEQWAAGFHHVVATWDRTTGMPAPGSLRWSFRVQ
jgi:hypothetical protein